ncbi:fasciclin domain-containing protein [Brevundimonas sp.]|uniref:fasciclin domain-containing protein n=1 Tax=Brevundimonas sp. TaxID=1871086 RepID=UPI002FC5F625
MLRLHLLTATAAAALLAAPAALAQTAPTPPPPSPVPVAPATPATPPASASSMPAPAATPAEPADEATPAAQAPTAQVPAAPPAAQAAQPATPAAAGNVIDVLTAQGNFTTLLAALNQAQLTDTLKSRPAVTIFAPTDEAFAALPEAERTRLMDPANAQELRNLLLYHVIVADVSSSQITGARGGVQTANRTRVLLDGTGEGLRIDGALVTRADIDASNGAIFAIDKVLNPAQSMAPPETPAAAPAASPAPAGTPATAPVPPGATATTRPATPGTNAPNGQPAATTTTIAAPPVPNPTDGQVDAQPDPSRTTPPVDTPDPADDDDDTPAPPPPTPGG